jgi:nitrite reductase/ring-hydroxylating ferredoxin subunit
MSMEPQSVCVGPVKDFERRFEVRKIGRQQFVVANLNGRFFAFDALCPHAQGPMERSEVDGFILSCPLHVWRFDLLNKGRELHGYRALRMYDLEIVDDQLFVKLDVSSLQ